MGEWSDYFEDYPEEDQANYVAGKFDPVGASAHRELRQKAALQLRRAQQQLNAEISAIVQKHKAVE